MKTKTTILLYLTSVILFCVHGGLRENECVKKAIEAGYVETGKGDKYFRWHWKDIVESKDGKLSDKCRSEVYFLGMQDAEDYAKFLERKGYSKSASKQWGGVDWVRSTWGTKASALCYGESSSVNDAVGQVGETVAILEAASKTEGHDEKLTMGEPTFQRSYKIALKDGNEQLERYNEALDKNRGKIRKLESDLNLLNEQLRENESKRDQDPLIIDAIKESIRKKEDELKRARHIRRVILEARNISKEGLHKTIYESSTKSATSNLPVTTSLQGDKSISDGRAMDRKKVMDDLKIKPVNINHEKMGSISTIRDLDTLQGLSKAIEKKETDIKDNLRRLEKAKEELNLKINEMVNNRSFENAGQISIINNELDIIENLIIKNKNDETKLGSYKTNLDEQLDDVNEYL